MMSAQSKKRKSQKILEAVETKKDQAQVSKTPLTMVELVIFTLLDDLFAFSLENIKEILPTEKINFVPGVPDFILGIVNVRGDIESVLSINQFLGLQPQNPENQNHIIIAEAQGVRSGILVGSVEDVMSFPQDQIKPPLSNLSETNKIFVRGQTEYKNQNVTILEVKEVFKKILTE